MNSKKLKRKLRRNVYSIIRKRKSFKGIKRRMVEKRLDLRNEMLVKEYQDGNFSKLHYKLVGWIQKGERDTKMLRLSFDFAKQLQAILEAKEKKLKKLKAHFSELEKRGINTRIFHEKLGIQSTALHLQTIEVRKWIEYVKALMRHQKES